jgi:hypothetical protein
MLLLMLLEPLRYWQGKEIPAFVDSPGPFQCRSCVGVTKTVSFCAFASDVSDDVVCCGCEEDDDSRGREEESAREDM